MKPILFLICGVLLRQEAQAYWSEKDRQIEAEQIIFWNNKLEESKQKPESVRVAELWLGLKNMRNRQNNVERSVAIDEIHKNLQAELISIPGHAQYFADEVETFRLRVQRVPRVNQTDYDSFRLVRIAEILPCLPSPETIKVLGNFLYDERDEPPERSYQPENAYLAAYGLSQIGLRDSPFEGMLAPIRLTYIPDWKQLPVFRAWWEEVKSGQRTFSFKGQAVEYRFKPDGTWDTIPIANPPDDAPKPVVERISATTTTPPPVARGNAWEWILLAMIGGLIAVVWAGLRSRNPV
jgi:hypothetical protein